MRDLVTLGEKEIFIIGMGENIPIDNECIIYTIDKTEEDLVNDCMKSTWISSKGAYINKFEEQIKKGALKAPFFSYVKRILFHDYFRCTSENSFHLNEVHSGTQIATFERNRFFS